MNYPLERQAALVLIVNPLRQVLAISRDHDVLDLGLPGGTAEPARDRTIADTAFRELMEETGVVARELSWLHEGMSGTHYVTTFRLESAATWPPAFRSTPFEGHVGWVAPERLLAPTCRYKDHARIILELGELLRC
jgi:8-oxo-dGTP pyrophosphatase MutT (NUDIX family)